MTKKVTHIIKNEYEDGKKLVIPKVWCGKDLKLEASFTPVMFTDLQHYALANEKKSLWGWPACKKCVKSAIKIMEQME